LGIASLLGTSNYEYSRSEVMIASKMDAVLHVNLILKAQSAPLPSFWGD